jgi:hypothetical protein
MNVESSNLAIFLERQLRDFGGNVEIAPGLWALFGVETGDTEANELARSLLTDVSFAYDSGSAEDDRWVLYYVDSANRPDAIHWLDDRHKQMTGEVRPPSLALRRLIDEIAESPMPHRVAQKLVEEHVAGGLSAGSFRSPKVVRALLDRLHVREPLFYSAFHQLLRHHLVDMVVLLQQLIAEDVGLLNESIKGAVSRDPFMQTRQDAAAEIRRILIEFCVINSLDQQKATAIANPYAAYMDVMRKGDEILLPLDGKTLATTPETLIDAVRSTRRPIYRGEQFAQFDTHVPWMREEIALPFRFIKQRLEIHRDLSPLDGLYMLERAAEV